MCDLFSVSWSVSEISDVWSCFILWSWLVIWWCLRLFGWDCSVEIVWLIEARLALFSPHRGVILCLLGCLKACFILTSQRCYFLLAWVFEGLLYFSPHMYDCEVLFFACLFDCVFYLFFSITHVWLWDVVFCRLPFLAIEALSERWGDTSLAASGQ